MKKLTEKDLSLDDQVVSNLSEENDTRNVTNNEILCASKVCTDSHFEICCAATKEDGCIASEACISVNDCPATNDSLCDDCTEYETCMCPITVTQCR